MDLKTKDVFQGRALIDRLLIYFGKFDGSRLKAARYAQKLLELGHIESLSQSSNFEDSSHVYRWTDVASVVNKAKAKVAAQERSYESNAVSNSATSKSLNEGQRRPTVRISIEADSCEGTEIQAHIRTRPRGEAKTDDAMVKDDGKTYCQADLREGRVISFVTETSKTEEVLRLVPISSSMIEDRVEGRRDDKADKRRIQTDQSFSTKQYSPSEHLKNREDSHVAAPGNMGTDTHLEQRTECERCYSENQEAVINHRSTHLNSASIVRPVTPGQGEPSRNKDVRKKANTQSDVAIQPISKSDKIHTSHTKESADEKKKLSGMKYKWKKETSNEHGICAAETQPKTNDQRCHDIKDGEDIRPQPRPRGYSPGTDDGLSHRSITSSSSLSSSTSDIRSRNGSPKAGPRFKFGNDQDWIRMRQEYLANEEIRQISEQRGKVVLVDNTASLHSSSRADECHREKANQSKCETIKEDSDDSEGPTETPESPLPGMCNGNLLKEPIQEMSPPVSPLPPSPRKPVDSGLKSLFWTKIKCDTDANHETEGVFWANITKDVKFDEEEFKKLFSKPPPNQQKSPITGCEREQDVDGKTLKVLAAERSRHVAIRANSVHLPIEEIHDAIINMDDTVLDSEALEVLYDVRPTPDELDDIANTLKHHPTGILDKPEQFLLMLAMINNLDDRLKSWIFLKKFPDKALEIREQLNALSNACIQIVRNKTIQNALAATLVFGNLMNAGTQRGEADGYFFDILPKLKDVKSQSGEMNLLRYIVMWILNKEEGEKERHSKMNKQGGETQDSLDDEMACQLPDQGLLHKASVVGLPEVLEEIENLQEELYECREQLVPAVVEGGTCMEDIKSFKQRIDEFITQAQKSMDELQKLSAETSEIAQEFRRYYIPTEEKSESLSNMLKYMEKFCDDFRTYWNAEKREAAKDAFMNMEKARWRRMATVKITTSPSALKARFLEKRKRERGSSVSKSRQKTGDSPLGNSQRSTKVNGVPSEECSMRRHLNGRERDVKCNKENPTSASSTRHFVKLTETSTANGSVQTPPARRNATPRRAERTPGKVTFSKNSDGGSVNDDSKKNDSQLELYRGKARKNSLEIEERLETISRQPANLSRMKRAMMQRKLLLKSKTC